MVSWGTGLLTGLSAQRRATILLITLLGFSPSVAHAQFSQSTSSSEIESWNDALTATTDYAFDYAQPGFYAMLDHLREAPLAPPCDAAQNIADWRMLLDRSSQFRGVPVIIEGVIRRNSSWKHTRPEQEKYGAVWELQLQNADQPLIAKVILTDNADDLPIGASIRVCAYFLMIQQYYSETNHLRQAAILVGRAPSAVISTTPVAPPTKSLALPALIAIAVGGLLAWWLIRRSATQDESS